MKLQCEELGWRASVRTLARHERRRTSTASARLPHGRQIRACHRALIAGLPTQIGNRGDKGIYDGPRGRKFQLFPGSTLAKKPPPWVLSATLLDTEKVWALTNAAIEPDWAIAELPHLLARRHHDPHWSRSQGRVIGSEQISLFGLVLAPKKPMHYGALFPEESREIFVREALLTGEINTRSAVPRPQPAHAGTGEAGRSQAAPRRPGRRRGLAGALVPRSPAAARAQRAGAGCVVREVAEGAEAGAGMVARRPAGRPTRRDAARFPAYIALGDARLAVRYRFEPGAIDDGMTVVVPLHLLNALDAARLSWLAPGFVEDKATALIKSLPKSLRRNFVPAPDFARAFAEAHPRPEADAASKARWRVSSRSLPASNSARRISTKPASSRTCAPTCACSMRDGEDVLAESRDLDELRERFGARAAEAFARHAARGHGAGRARPTFPEAADPESVPGAGGVPAFPALQDDGDSRRRSPCMPQREVAERLHPQGVRRLLAIALADKLQAGAQAVAGAAEDRAAVCRDRVGTSPRDRAATA